MLWLHFIIPTKVSSLFQCFSAVHLYRWWPPQSEGSLRLKSQAPINLLPQPCSSSALQQAPRFEYPMGSPLLCPASLLCHPSRGWVQVLSPHESWWWAHYQAARQCMLQVSLHAQQTRGGCPCWWNDQPEAPQIKPPAGKAGEGWEAEGYSLSLLSPRDTFLLQHPGNRRVISGWTNLKLELSEVCVNTSAWFFCSMWTLLWLQVSTQNSKQNCWNHRLLQNLHPK